MSRRTIRLPVSVLTAAVRVGCTAGMPRGGTEAPTPVKLDVMFVAAEREVVNAMLMRAGVTRDGVVYDLGCGDGRIVIVAAKDFGDGVGVDVVNARLQPKFMTQLKPGSRIVSHRVGLGKFVPERTLTLSVRGTRDRIFLWRMP